jgi:3-deoxy-7-phosphoheptulonate synthase
MILLAKPMFPSDVAALKEELESQGLKTCRISTTQGPLCTVLDFDARLLASLPPETGSYTLLEVKEPYVLAGRNIKDNASEIAISECVTIGGSQLTVIAGPCSIESAEQIAMTAECVKKSGAQILRGGAFKPRTSPYSFQGMGEEGLKWLKMAGERTGLPIITEILD